MSINHNKVIILTSIFILFLNLSIPLWPMMGVNLKVYNCCCTSGPFQLGWEFIMPLSNLCFVSSHVQFYWIMKIIDRQAKKFNKWRKICFQHLNILNPGLDFQRAGWARFKRVPDVQWPFFPSQHPKAYYAILNTLPIICPHVLAHFV